MEIHYQNTREDFKAFYDDLWRDKRAALRRDYYHAAFWYLAVLGLGAYVGLKHEEYFAVCVFAALGGFYIRQNWSFAQQWNARAESYADMTPESACNLTIDETGLVERFGGIQLQVVWSQVPSYSVRDDRLFIHFLNYRSFIVPLRCLSASQRDELIKMLEAHGVRSKA